MSGFIEIIVSLIVVGIVVGYINYVLGFFGFLPEIITAIILFMIALNVVLFIIHRK